MDAGQTAIEKIQARTCLGQHVIVFDGACVMCSSFMQLIARRDKAARCRFLIAQSPLGEALYAETGLKHADYDTVIVLREGQLLQKLDATAAVMADLGWPWRALSPIRHLPLALKTWLYDRVAGNRFRLFGRRETCVPADPAIKSRLIV